MKVEIQYIRSVCFFFYLHLLYEELEFKNKTQMMKHVRETKKKIASECHYRFPQDVVNYIIKEIKEK